MFILIYKIFTFDFYHASEIAFFGNTAQKKRTIGDLHVSCGRDISRPYEGVARKTKGGTQNDGMARKTMGSTQNDGMAHKTKGWHTKRRVARKTMGSTQNEGVARKTKGVAHKTKGLHAKRWVAHKTKGWYAKR